MGLLDTIIEEGRIKPTFSNLHLEEDAGNLKNIPPKWLTALTGKGAGQNSEIKVITADAFKTTRTKGWEGIVRKLRNVIKDQFKADDGHITAGFYLTVNGEPLALIKTDQNDYSARTKYNVFLPHLDRSETENKTHTTLGWQNQRRYHHYEDSSLSLESLGNKLYEILKDSLHAGEEFESLADIPAIGISKVMIDDERKLTQHHREKRKEGSKPGKGDLKKVKEAANKKFIEKKVGDAVSKISKKIENRFKTALSDLTSGKEIDMNFLDEVKSDIQNFNKLTGRIKEIVKKGPFETNWYNRNQKTWDYKRFQQDLAEILDEEK